MQQWVVCSNGLCAAVGCVQDFSWPLQGMGGGGDTALPHLSTAALRKAGLLSLRWRRHTGPSLTSSPLPASALPGKKAVPCLMNTSARSIRTCRGAVDRSR